MKHEKVTILLLAYVIGFTTAFIAFGIDLDGLRSRRANDEASQQASISKAVSTKVIEKEDGLYVVTEEKDRILSAVATEKQIGREGFHNSIVSAQVSPSGDLIHYCAQLRPEDNFCFNYVYDLNSDSIRRVQTSSSDHVASLTSASGDSWVGERTLLIEGLRSISSDTPWRLQ